MAEAREAAGAEANLIAPTSSRSPRDLLLRSPLEEIGSVAHLPATLSYMYPKRH
jgi:hypothetical protein